MHATLPLLINSEFPAIRRDKLELLQINLGYLCNQSCLHCHVNAGPSRKEIMTLDVIEEVLDFLKKSEIKKIDLTGGAPELNPHFYYLVEQARSLGVHVIDRCNLTVLFEAGHTQLANFMAEQAIEIIASLPCYMEENVDQQRGNGVFELSVKAIKLLNQLGYGQENTSLSLHLVYNPLGPYLPPSQVELEKQYKTFLWDNYGIVFNQLFTLTNLPIQRFGSTLITKGEFSTYMDLLKSSYKRENLSAVMCRSLMSVDWQGYVYDCDFNQMLNLPLSHKNRPRVKLCELSVNQIEGNAISVADHCFACTAGQGSSCGGALSN